MKIVQCTLYNVQCTLYNVKIDKSDNWSNNASSLKWVGGIGWFPGGVTCRIGAPCGAKNAQQKVSTKQQTEHYKRWGALSRPGWMLEGPLWSFQDYSEFSDLSPSPTSAETPLVQGMDRVRRHVQPKFLGISKTHRKEEEITFFENLNLQNGCNVGEILARRKRF